jgi:predicted transcriptional regulator
LSPRNTLHTILSVSKTPSPGPAPAFTAVHVCRAILYIGDIGPIGRIELSRKLGLGEGAVRTIIRHLTSGGIVETATGGCAFTQRGAALYKSLRSKLSEIRPVNAEQLAMDKASAAVLVRGSRRLLRRGIEQRDAAIRAGATGAVTLIQRNGQLVMPMSGSKDSASKLDALLYHELKNSFAPSDGDVITIVSAPNHELAEHCVIAAALTLIE